MRIATVPNEQSSVDRTTCQIKIEDNKLIYQDNVVACRMRCINSKISLPIVAAAILSPIIIYLFLFLNRDWYVRNVVDKDNQYTDANRIFSALLTPRRITEGLRELYEIFVALPQSMQRAFLHELDCAPCDLEYTPALDLSPSQLSIYNTILKHVPSKRRDDAVDMLRLMSAHNICIDKGDIVRREIEHLMGFDVSTIPKRWRSGHLDEAVLKEERVRELKVMLQRKKIRTS